MQRHAASQWRSNASGAATPVALMLLLLLQCWVAAALQQPSLSDSGTAEPNPPCVIEVYGAKNVALMEYRFTWTVLLSHIPHQCGCRFLIKDREGFVAAVRALDDYKQPSMILVGARGITPEEQAAIMKSGSNGRSKLVVIHQSDENNDHDLSWYPSVKAVFRNYHRDLASLKLHMQYLHSGLDRPPRLPSNTGSVSMSGGGGNKSKQRRETLATPQASQALKSGNVYWIPLGFGEPFVPSPAMQIGIMSRPLLWSWTGSLGKKPERQEMIKYLNTTEMMAQGVLYTFERFKSLEQLPPVRYSTLLHESKFVPLPPGIHPEQFRIYEVLSAGAIPVALKTHANSGLAHLNLLRFKALWIDSWKEAPRIMKEVLTNESMQHEMSAWQTYNTQQYARVMRIIKQQVAEVVCSLPREA